MAAIERNALWPQVADSAGSLAPTARRLPRHCSHLWRQLDRQPLGKHACPAANNRGRSEGGRFWEVPLIPTTSFANQQIVGSSPTAGSKILKNNRAALRHDRAPPRCRTSFTCSLPGHCAVWVAALQSSSAVKGTGRKVFPISLNWSFGTLIESFASSFVAVSLMSGRSFTPCGGTLTAISNHCST